MKKMLYLAFIFATILLAFYQSLFPIPLLTSAIRFLALEGFFLLCISLAIGPLALFFPKTFGGLVKSRKAIGIAAFAAVFLHYFLVIFLNYGGNHWILFSSPSLTLSFLAFLILALMAVTSINWALKKLGFLKWKTIQRLVYIAFALSLAHFLLSANGLFVIVGSRIFVNAAELALLALAFVVILLQAFGFFKMRSLKARHG